MCSSQDEPCLSVELLSSRPGCSTGGLPGLTELHRLYFKKEGRGGGGTWCSRNSYWSGRTPNIPHLLVLQLLASTADSSPPYTLKIVHLTLPPLRPYVPQPTPALGTLARSQVWKFMAIIPEHKKLKQEDCRDFKASVGYMVSFRTFWVLVRDCLKTRERKLR